MKTLHTLFFLLCSALLAFGNADVTFTIGDFTVSSTINRTVWITPISVVTTSGHTTVIGDRYITNSGTGTFTVLNMVPSLYEVTVKAPPMNTTWRILVNTNTTGSVDASDLISTDVNATYPFGQVAYSAAASDSKYLPIPTNNSAGTDGQVASKTGDKTKWITAGGGGQSNVMVQIFADGTVTLPPPLAPITPTSSRTAGIQEAIDALPQVLTIFNGVGGGEIKFEYGTFRVFTNIVIPDYMPFALRMHGAAFNGTLVQGEWNDAATNKAMFSCATNHINGLGLTNALSLWVSDMGFCHTNETQTNFLWDVTGQTFCKFDDCMFTTKAALLHGQGGYSLNYDPVFPHYPVGLVGIAASKDGDNANCQLYVQHCLFYGLANGVLMNPVIGRIENSYFANVGTFNTTPGPNFEPTTYFSHTNLWRGGANSANADYRGWLSTGAAIVIGNNTPNIWVKDNVFFACGAMAAVGLDGNAGPGAHVINFRDNYNAELGIGTYQGTQFHILTADSASITCTEFFEGTDFHGDVYTDSLVTNGPAGNPVCQPSHTSPAVPIPTAMLVHSGTILDGDSYFLFTSGGQTSPRIIANGLGITNLDAGNLQTGTVPTARLPDLSGTYIARNAGIGTNVTIRGDASATNALYVAKGGVTISNALGAVSVSGASVKVSGAIVFTNGVNSVWITNYPGNNGGGLSFYSVRGGEFGRMVAGDNPNMWWGTANFVTDDIGANDIISGGSGNAITNSAQAVIAGGSVNIISNFCPYSAIGGGRNNFVSGSAPVVAAIIPGGVSNFVSASGAVALGSYITNSTANSVAVGSGVNAAYINSDGTAKMIGSIAFVTNSSGTKPNFLLKYTLVTTNAAFTILAPSGVDSTKTLDQETHFYVTNSTALVVNIIPPANVHTNGVWNVTNLTEIIFTCHGGVGFTNATAVPWF